MLSQHVPRGDHPPSPLSAAAAAAFDAEIGGGGGGDHVGRH